MKKQLLFAALLASTGAFAQLIPSGVTSPSDVYFLSNEIPGVRKGFTELKVRVPAINGDSYATWYNFTVGVSNSVVTSTNYLNVDPANPLTEEYRSTGSMTGNVYTAIVEFLDNDWELSEKQTAYFNASGQDTLWVLESYDAVNSVYEYDSRITKRYDASGNFTGYVVEEYNGTDWEQAGFRNIAYNGNQRTTDTVYYINSGIPFPIFYGSYFYVNNKLDSIAWNSTDGAGGFDPAYGLKITLGADGGVDQVKEYIYQEDGDSFMVATRCDFTGGTAPSTGVKEISADRFGIYPVPASHTLNVEVKDGGVYVAELFDMQGRSLLASEVSGNSALNVSTLTNGIYILTLQNEKGERMQKRVMIAK